VDFKKIEETTTANKEEQSEEAKELGNPVIQTHCPSCLSKQDQPFDFCYDDLK
jgi:hypothetical protein